MKKRLLAVMLTAAMTTALLMGCGSSGSSSSTDSGSEEVSEEGGDSGSGSESASSGDTIKFAVIAPMTGNDANSGFQQVNGVQVAVDEVNAAGGINGKMLEYDVYDDQLIPEQCIIAAEKIAANADQYKFTVSTISSGCTNSILPILSEVDMPLIGCVNADYLTTQGYTNFLRPIYTDITNVVDLVRIAVDEKGCKNPAILYSSSDIDTSRMELVTKMLKEKGVEVAIASQFQPDTDKDFSSFITSFKEKDCDCIFVHAEYGAMGLFLKQAQNQMFDVPVLATSGGANVNVISIAGGSACENMVTTCGFYTDAPENASFVEAYEKLSDGEAPGEPAAGGYDMIKIMADALNNGAEELDGTELVDWIKENTHIEEGLLLSPCDFDENGDNEIATSVLLTVKDDKFVLYE